MMKADKCPSEQLSLKNRVIVNPADLGSVFGGCKHVDVQTGPGT